ncbi:putative cytochrome P450 6a14 [Dufourea novaeangliae]|uniref:Putative cytochrome P450 6a14 n=1 Tax=Dufourea novaeangliae TaxID=178035 RepID=A0A154NXB1_DUFNO|nr:putative cytochrome P450 6a14 [Dufourea novaeangliae]
MTDSLVTLCGVLIILFLLYYYLTSNLNFWKDRGIPGPQPIPIFGNFGPLSFRTLSINYIISERYNEYKHEPAFGVFAGSTPAIIVNDMDMIRDVLIRDFSLFADRGISLYPKMEPLSLHLFNLETEIWRPLRTRISPVFTSGKLKEMFPLVVECGQHLEKHLDKLVAKGEPIECRELAAQFTTDVIGSCGFGIDMNAISDEDSEFRIMGREIFNPDPKVIIKDLCKKFCPILYRVVGPLLQKDHVLNFFKKVVVDTIKYREQNNIMRPDFINMLMELKKNRQNLENIGSKSSVSVERILDIDKKRSPGVAADFLMMFSTVIELGILKRMIYIAAAYLTDDLLASVVFGFFIAGFETSSSAMSNALYELALNTDIQDKVRNEIRENFAQHDETFTYEQVKQMKYLDLVFQETLRKYPVLPVLMRRASTNYTFKGTNITIPKNTNIWIPVRGIHLDPDIYPKPKVFDPERFTKEAVSARHPMSYLPFGDGPRNCVGMSK